VLSINSDVRLGAAPGAPVADQLTFNGGTLRSTATFTINANRGITLDTGGGTFNVSAGTTSYGGVIAGPGGFTLTGGGILGLSNPNTYEGHTHIVNGQVHLKGGAAEEIFGSTAQGTTVEALGTIVWADHGPTANEILVEPITLNGGRLVQTASTNGGLSGSLTLTADSRVDGNAATFTISGAITGLGGLTIGGGGTKRFTSTGNTYSGPTTLNQGTLQILAGSSLGNTSALTVQNLNSTAAGNNVILTLSNGAQTVGSLSGLIATPISGVNNASINMGTNYDLTINQTVDGTYQGTLNGTGAKITMSAASTATLSLEGANTYTGGTTINGGTLLVNNLIGSGTGTGNVIVNNTGSIGGAGTIAGTLTLNAGATLKPGNSTGILTVQGAGGVVMNAGSIFEAEIGGTTPGLHDQLVVTNGVTLGGLLDVSFLSGTTLLYEDEIVLITAGSISGMFTNAPFDGAKLTVGNLTFSVNYDANQVFLSQFEIPEPSSITLLGLGMVLLAKRRRRGQKS